PIAVGIEQVEVAASYPFVAAYLVVAVGINVWKVVCGAADPGKVTLAFAFSFTLGKRIRRMPKNNADGHQC
ncbi:MAG: hypothetical protein HOL37_08975, partial [Rhodospirillaceae bacterium]|nr:hypothetical protein [Rhodospirillaceae bacterium]